MKNKPASWSKLKEAIKTMNSELIQKAIDIQLQHQPEADAYEFLTRTLDLAAGMMISEKIHKENNEKPLDVECLSDLLSLVAKKEIPLETIEGWDDETKLKVEEWAAAVHFSASDNDCEVPEMPNVIIKLEES